jgi:hypothetical protein
MARRRLSFSRTSVQPPACTRVCVIPTGVNAPLPLTSRSDVRVHVAEESLFVFAAAFSKVRRVTAPFLIMRTGPCRDVPGEARSWSAVACPPWRTSHRRLRPRQASASPRALHATSHFQKRGGNFRKCFVFPSTRLPFRGRQARLPGKVGVSFAPALHRRLASRGTPALCVQPPAGTSLRDRRFSNATRVQNRPRISAEGLPAAVGNAPRNPIAQSTHRRESSSAVGATLS